MIQKPSIRPVQITINNNRDSAIVFALNNTNLNTITPEEVYELLKSSPLTQAALGMLINAITMSISFKTAKMLAIALNPIAWLELAGYALFSSGPLRGPAGV